MIELRKCRRFKSASTISANGARLLDPLDHLNTRVAQMGLGLEGLSFEYLYYGNFLSIEIGCSRFVPFVRSFIRGARKMPSLWVWV